jgi:hypothetical protein
MTADQNASEVGPEKQSNGIGTAGFIVSLVAVPTCGVLSPVALVLSLLGLKKRPNGLAIAGTVIGAVGTVWLALVGVGMVMAFLGLKKVAKETGGDVPTTVAMGGAMAAIISHVSQDGKLPESAAGNALIAEFKDSAGRALRYEPSGQNFVIRGAGKDGVFDTPDDVTMQSTTETTTTGVKFGVKVK